MPACCNDFAFDRRLSTSQVYPTYLWAEEDLTLLEGSPVIAATESMRRKLEAEYATVESDLLKKFPKVGVKRDLTSRTLMPYACMFLFNVRLHWVLTKPVDCREKEGIAMYEAGRSSL